MEITPKKYKKFKKMLKVLKAVKFRDKNKEEERQYAIQKAEEFIKKYEEEVKQ